MAGGVAAVVDGREIAAKLGGTSPLDAREIRQICFCELLADAADGYDVAG